MTSGTVPTLTLEGRSRLEAKPSARADAFGAFNIVGNYLGSHSFSKNGGAVARPITIVVLVIFFAKVIWDFVA